MSFWNYFTSIKKSSTRDGFAFLEFLFSVIHCQINSIDTSKQLQVLSNRPPHSPPTRPLGPSLPPVTLYPPTPLAPTTTHRVLCTVLVPIP